MTPTAPPSNAQGGPPVKRVVVDYDVCASTATCTTVLPEVFEIRADGYLYLLGDAEKQLSVELLARAQEAADSCPTGAISIVDD
jgi:ferredoxin